jgi:hypothetical protein
VNMISNPGFESGLSGWTPVSAASSTKTPHSGSKDAALTGLTATAKSASSRKAPSASTLTAELTSPGTAGVTTTATGVTTVGGVYHANVWLAAPTGTVHAVLRLREMHGTKLVGQSLAYVAVNGPTWHQLSLSYTAVGDGDSLNLTILSRRLVSGQSLLVDDAWVSLGSGLGPSPSGSDSSSPSVTPSPTVTPSQTPSPTSTPTSTPTVTPSPSPSVTPSSPPPPATALIGGSVGGSLSALEAGFPNMGVVRFFYPGAPPVWGGSIATIPSGQVIFVSFNYDVASTATGGSDAAFTQVLQSWAASGRQIYWTWQHEADDPAKAIPQAAYQAGWAHLLADAGAVNAPNLHSMSILMGIALTGVHGSVEGWYVPGVDVLGFDCYYLNTELLAEQYAASKHQPVAFPEFGAAIGGSPDPASAVFAQQFITALNSNTIGAVWFNNYGNNLSSHPMTLAVLRAAAG